MPLNDEYSFDYNLESSLRANTGRNNSEKMPVSRENTPENDGKVPVTDKKVPLTKKIAPVSAKKMPEKNASKKVQKKTLEQYAAILAYMSDVPECSSAELCGVLNVKSRRIRELLRQLEDAGKIEATATYRNRRYRVKS